MFVRNRSVSDDEFRRLARWRAALRKFLRFSETAARRAGISPSQHQLLLFVRGAEERAPTIGALAELLQVRHQSAVGLIDRTEKAGLLRRQRDPADARRVRVEITPRGDRILERLTLEHRRELGVLKDAFPAL